MQVAAAMAGALALPSALSSGRTRQYTVTRSGLPPGTSGRTGVCAAPLGVEGVRPAVGVPPQLPEPARSGVASSGVESIARL